MSVTATVGAVVSGFALSGVGAWLVLRLGGRHAKTNFRGAPVVATGGLALLPALIAGWVWALIGADEIRVAAVMAGAGALVALLGLLDDLFGDRHAGGLWGHAHALVRGQVTTGMVKAVGGVAVGLGAAWWLGWRGWWLLVAGAVVAMSANMANLLDVRPGRVIKVWYPLEIALTFSHVPGGGEVVLVAVAGGLVVVFALEMGERLMLGDTGAGLLGVVLGVGAAGSFGRFGLAVTAAVLAAFTLVSEMVSFTRVIEAVPPLRWLDELGRRR